jgi:hypothetical protein
MSVIDPVTKNPVVFVPQEELTYLQEAERRHLVQDGRFWVTKVQYLLDLIDEVRPQKYLDFGCSGGHFLEGVRVADKCGFEPDSYARAKAASRGLKVYADWKDVPQVQCITVIDVIEHMQPREMTALLYQLRDKLDTGGTVIFQSDNPRCIFAHLDFFNDYTHVRMYDVQSMLNLLNLTGYSTSKVLKAIRIGDLVNLSPTDQTRLQSLPDVYADPFMKWVIVAQKVV